MWAANVAAGSLASNIPERCRRSGDASRDVNRHVGERMRERRKVLGLPIKQVAQSPGVTVLTTREWESGRHIAPGRLTKLAEVLNVPVSYFFSGLDEEASYGTTSAKGRGGEPPRDSQQSGSKVIGRR